MACNCSGGGSSSKQKGTASVFIPASGTAGDSSGSAPAIAAQFCWKCFLFWALVALAAVLFLTYEKEN